MKYAFFALIALLFICPLSLAESAPKPIDYAYSEIGVSETQHPDRASGYWHAFGLELDSRKFAWCSAFAASMVERAGLSIGAANASARSWLHVGAPVYDPKAGDIVVFWREAPDSWKGHVGFYVSETETHIHVLGGNQSNKVSIQAYTKDQLLGYRRLSD